MGRNNLGLQGFINQNYFPINTYKYKFDYLIFFDKYVHDLNAKSNIKKF